jgi:tRNA A37 threonylcarbamoyladenosine dehydratase
LGPEGLRVLGQKKVAVIGIGGVGSFAAEALARCGIGSLRIVDHDIICETNMNRQLHALSSTIGHSKVGVMAERLLDINPELVVDALQLRYSQETGEQIITPDLDYVIDAVDMVTAKLHIICRAKELEIPVISCMGAGNKLDPTRFEVVDISRTSICPLARIVRKELGKRGYRKGVKVVYSKEEPQRSHAPDETGESTVTIGSGVGAYKRRVPGSVSFVPSVAGLIAAGEVVRDLVRSQA